MAKPGRVGDLDIAEDIEFQRRAWLVQRFGWALMALTVAAALAGVFGGGQLAKARAQGGGVELEYDRLLRRTHTSELLVRLDQPAGADAVRIAFDQGYLERIEIRAIAPMPVRVEGSDKGTVFVFAPGTSQREFMFRIKAEHSGPLPGRIGRDGAQPIAFTAFVFP